MDWLADLAHVGTILSGLTGLTVVTAVGIGVKRWWQRRRDHKQAKQLRNWHGFIDIGGINTWNVRLVEPAPGEPTATVLLEVVGPDGKPDISWARNLRQTVATDGRLSRSPTTEELDFLKYLQQERGYGKGIRVQ